jgi:hypothetical protein
MFLFFNMRRGRERERERETGRKRENEIHTQLYNEKAGEKKKCIHIVIF